MLMNPHKRISLKALQVWRIYGVISSFIFLLVCGGVIFLTVFFQWQPWIVAVAIIIAAIYTYFFVFMFPRLKWKRWRYEVRESEIELQHGVLIIKRTLIPMIRVQHVDTKQGPILKKYKLATVAISTAATIHEIPALDEAEAEELRFFIGKLTKVADEDV